MKDTTRPHISVAVVSTDHASRYLQQLCKHWGHKFAVDFNPEHGTIEFSPEAAAEFRATDEALTLEARHANAEGLDTFQGVIADHLKRFAFREELHITWITS